MCIERLCILLPVLVEYFTAESKSKSNTKKQRNQGGKLLAIVTEPKFLNYLHFLNGELPEQAKMNRELQKRNQTMFETYENMLARIMTIRDEMNLLPPFGTYDFQQYWQKCNEEELLTQDEQWRIVNNCFMYLVTIGRSFVRRFPELEFVVKVCGFMDPANRKVQFRKEVQMACDRFTTGNFNKVLLGKQYMLYRHSSNLDRVFNDLDRDPIQFHSYLYKDDEFHEFGKLCVLIDTISPDTCDVERGFSALNGIKTLYRNRLTQRHLNDCMAIHLHESTSKDFPFHRCLK
jgi:hypothetical protein